MSVSTAPVNAPDPTPPVGMQLVPWDSFAELWQQVAQLREEVAFWQTASTAAVWFTRQQAMIFLGVGSTKLWELQKAGTIKTSGTKYEVQSCRAYLLDKATSKEIIRQRLDAALIAKRSK